jgi:ubiquinol-cytochrome c reductase cytochrome c subunit
VIRALARFLGIAAVVLAGLSGASPARARTTPVEPIQQLHRGEELYLVHCSSCHGMQLQGSPLAPTLQGVGPAAVDFWLSTGRMPAMVPPNVQAMHQQPQFSLDDINALVAFVSRTAPGGPAIPVLGSLDAGNALQRGRAIYAANCQACHGAMAQGGAVGYGYVAPPLYDATVLQVAEAVRTGPGPMPEFGPKQLDRADLDAVVHYVNVLQTAQIHPGGFNLANIGPVAEGLVSWVLGMGVLFGLIRAIGSKT